MKSEIKKWIFNGTEYRKFTDIALEFALQHIFKKLSFVGFGDSVNRDYTQLLDKVLKSFIFPIYLYLCEAGGFFPVLEPKQHIAAD